MLKGNIVVGCVVICAILVIYNVQLRHIEEKRSAVLIDQITDLNEQLANLRAQKTYEQGVKDGIELKDQKLYMDGYHMATQHMNGILTHTSTNEVVNNGE